MAGCSNRTRQGCAVALSQASSLRDPLGAGGPAQFLGTRGKETLQYVEGPFAAAPGGNKCKAVLWGASPCSASSPFLSCHGATPAMSLDSPDKVILFFFPSREQSSSFSLHSRRASFTRAQSLMGRTELSRSEMAPESLIKQTLPGP